MKRIIPLIFVSILIAACSSDDGNTEKQANVYFNFNHHWDGENFTTDNFNLFDYTNEYGNTLSINYLRYLISDIQFIKESGERVSYYSPYIFIDIEDLHKDYPDPNVIPPGNYTGIEFTFGFNENMNTGGLYPELNSASWNWPEMLGNGYHYLQMEGFYQSATTPQPYTYHMGTARESEGVFDNNHFTVTLNQNFTVNSDSVEIELKMNLAEWFKNPHTWNLEEYNINLMMNYTVQKMMHDNGKSVFSLGNIQ